MKTTDEIITMLQELSQIDLNGSQAHFITGLKKWYKKTGKLSEKQYSCLKSIHEAAFQNVNE
jgi:hypothetical protein